MKITTMIKISEAKNQASAGVDFSPRTGALCPWCEKKSRITRTMLWEDATRIRYHRCENGKCPLSTMRVSIKSIEIDPHPKNGVGNGR